MFKSITGVDILHVPYKGPAPALTDLLAGQVQMYFESVGLMLPYIQAGQLRALAVADEARDPQLANVPTTAESGFSKLQATFWTGILAPAATPKAVVNRLNTEINAIMKTGEMEALLAKLSAKAKLIARILERFPIVHLQGRRRDHIATRHFAKEDTPTEVLVSFGEQRTMMASLRGVCTGKDDPKPTSTAAEISRCSRLLRHP
jgi:hypothetical protein